MNGATKLFNNPDTAAASYIRPGSSAFERSAFNLISNGVFIVDWNFSTETSVSSTAGNTGLMSGRPFFNEITITKYVDQYSPTLFNFLVSGTPLTTSLAWITTNQATGAVVVKTVYYFNGALLSGQAHARADEQPAEKLTFEYAQLAMGSAFTAVNGGQSVATGSWNVFSQRRCSTPECPSWIA